MWKNGVCDSCHCISYGRSTATNISKHNQNKILFFFSVRFVEREGTWLAYIVHVSITICRRLCVQCIDAWHTFVSSICQRLCDYICTIAVGHWSGARKRISHFCNFIRNCLNFFFLFAFLCSFVLFIFLGVFYRSRVISFLFFFVSFSHCEICFNRWKSPRTTCGYERMADYIKNCVRQRAKYQLVSIEHKTHLAVMQHMWVVHLLIGGDHFHRLDVIACDCDHRWVRLNICVAQINFATKSKQNKKRNKFKIRKANSNSNSLSYLATKKTN